LTNYKRYYWCDRFIGWYGILVALNALEIINLSHKGWLGLVVFLGTSVGFWNYIFLIGSKNYEGWKKTSSVCGDRASESSSL